MTIRLRIDNFRKASTLAGYTSVYGLAKAMEVNRSSLQRVLEGVMRPGSAFIAGAVTVLKPFTFEDLFEVVAYVPQKKRDNDPDDW
ncbi:transcriptional regulator [Actinosynnema sp. NPDC023587]|uniref:transcriptional regulator n=1 Tax=Actinosynnema sp. NPDC023587 TaxID=3154695 RepID=UPI003407B0D6